MWRGWLRERWHSLSRLRFGVILLALLLGAVILGTLFPQLPRQGDTTTWWETVRDRYGALYGPLRALGLFNLPDTLWLKALLGLLLLSTLACFLNRVLPLSKVVFRARTRIPAERFERAALRAQFTFRSAEAAESSLREALGRRRYRVQVERRQLSDDSSESGLYLRADRYRLPRLGTILTHIGLVFLLLGAALSGLRSWRELGLSVNSDQVARVGNGTGVGLQCYRFTVLRHSDGTPQDYRAEVTVIAEDGQPLTHGAVRVNQPLTYAGVSYYLQGFHLPGSAEEPADETKACEVTLNAVYDPGYGLIIAAGFCLLFGVTLTFHFPHRRLWARVESTGQTVLVGSTAWDRDRFGRQFEALGAELKEAEAQHGRAPETDGVPEEEQ